MVKSEKGVSGRNKPTTTTKKQKGKTEEAEEGN